MTVLRLAEDIKKGGQGNERRGSPWRGCNLRRGTKEVHTARWKVVHEELGRTGFAVP